MNTINDVLNGNNVAFFQHKGYRCATVNHVGNACSGYVELPPEHPWLPEGGFSHTQAFDQLDQVDIPGGIIFTNGRVIGFVLENEHNGKLYHFEGILSAIHNNASVRKTIKDIVEQACAA